MSEWLNAELRDRGWTERELARRAGLSHTAINNALTGRYKTRLDTYKGISRALSMPLGDVLRRAGELPDLPPAVSREEEATRLFRKVPGEYRSLALRVLEVFADAERLKNTNPKTVDTLAPGESILIRRWDDHPLFRVLENLEGKTEAEIGSWLLGLVVESEVERMAATREKEKPGIGEEH